MTPAEIRSAIAADPALTALLPDSQAIADAMSAGRTVMGSVRRPIFSMWCGRTGLRAAIEAHAKNDASPLQSIALTLQDFLKGAAEEVDFAHPDNVAMLGAWQAAGAITQAQADELLGLAMIADPVAEMDVRRAIWNEDGSRAL